MITLPDFKEKRILSVTVEFGHDNLLNLTNDNIRFVRDGEVINQISCHLVFAIFIIGDMSITTSLLKKLNSLGISIFFLNQNLSVKASIMTEAEGNFLLRQKQYTSTNNLLIATNIIANKISSQEAVLKKYKKDYNSRMFTRSRKMLKNVRDCQQLLGVEGNIGKIYFQSLFSSIGWVRRAPQTKEDITNLLLDIGYTYLFNYCNALLKLFGFDTYKGYYHQLFFQRKSLACDIMEPMRPLVDSQLLKSFNLKQVKENDFSFKNGGFIFKDGFKTNQKYSALFLEAINEYKEEIYQYILNFYRYIMDDKKYIFPQFKI